MVMEEILLKSGTTLSFLGTLICLHVVQAAVPLTDFFPYTVDDGITLQGPECDDCLSARIPLQVGFQFFEQTHQKLIISPNGYITFDEEFSEFRDVCGPKGDVPAMIMPYWADATSAQKYWDDIITFSQRMDDKASLKKASSEIQAAHPAFEDIEVQWIFIVTWVVSKMGHPTMPWPKAKYQMVLASDYSNYFTIFFYNSIGWTVGEIQGNDHAHVGYHAADGVASHTYKLPDSCNASIGNAVLTGSNYGRPGKYVFRLDNNPTFASAACDDWYPGKRLAIKPRALAMEGLKSIKVRGPCLTENTEITCIFTERADDEPVVHQLPGSVLDRDTAECPTPIFTIRGKVKFQMRVNGSEPLSYLRATSDEPDADLQVSSPSDSFLTVASAGSLLQHLSIKWDPALLNANKLVFACRHEWDSKDTDQWLPASKILMEGNKEAKNTGQALIDKSDVTGDKKRGGTLFTISIQQGTECMGNPGSTGGSTRILLANVEEVQAALLDPEEKKVTSNVKYIQCPSRIPQVSKKGTLPCPPTLALAKSDYRFKLYADIYYQYLKDAKNCYIQINPGKGFRQTAGCCYNSAGNIICGTPQSATDAPSHALHYHPEKYPWHHMMKDVTLWYLCCYVDGPNSRACKRQYLPSMAPDCGKNYKKPQGPGTHGDPHFTSIDELKFTFNGFGEYTLVATQTCEVQVRMEPYHPPMNEVVNTTAVLSRDGPGTVISGMAFQCQDSDALELLEDPTKTFLQPVLKGELFKFPNGTHDMSTGSVYMSMEIEDEVPVYYVSLQDSLFTFMLRLDAGTINMGSSTNCMDVDVGTTGLVGDCDGDPSNDLKPRHGKPLPVNATMEDIHYKFGETWRVTEKTTLFSYAYGLHRSYQSVNKPKYIPTLHVPTKSEFSQEIQALCGDVHECYFDYNATGSTHFAKATVLAVEAEKNRTETVAAEMENLPELPADYVDPDENVNTEMAPSNENQTDVQQHCSGLNTEVNGKWENVGDQAMRLVCNEHFVVVGADTVNCVNGTVEEGQKLPCCRNECNPHKGLLYQLFCYVRLMSMRLLVGHCA